MKEKKLNKQESLERLEEVVRLLDYIACHSTDIKIQREADYLAENVSNSICDLMM